MSDALKPSKKPLPGTSDKSDLKSFAATPVLADRIRDRCKAIGKTQEAVAGKVGIKRSTFQMWLRGKIRLSAKRFTHLMDILNLCE